MNKGIRQHGAVIVKSNTSDYKMEPAMSVTSIRLSKEVEVPLENLSVKLERSKNYLINQAVKEFVARQAMEDARWSDTLEALDSVKSGKSIDANEVESWLQSWGSADEKAPPKG
jgi:predicted transcriptional regulator